MISILVRGLRISGALTLFAAMVARWPLSAALSGLYALLVASAAYTTMLVPALFQRS